MELYYYDARWYDPAAGRFFNEDPAGLDEDVNLTQYYSHAPTAAQTGRRRESHNHPCQH